MSSPEAQTPEATERMKIAGVPEAPASPQAAAQPKPAPAVNATIAGMTPEELEEVISRVLGAKKREAFQKAQAQPEPDWATLKEVEALDLRVSNIPVYEHEVPSYMDIKVADPNYEVVWANRDQRRLGHLLAEGYEFLRREHVDPNFQLPLKFDSEGMYIYVDVVALRVHKRILFGKRRKVVEKSVRQLQRLEDHAKSKLQQITSRDSHLEEAFEEGKMQYYS